MKKLMILVLLLNSCSNPHPKPHIFECIVIRQLTRVCGDDNFPNIKNMLVDKNDTAYILRIQPGRYLLCQQYSDRKNTYCFFYCIEERTYVIEKKNFYPSPKYDHEYYGVDEDDFHFFMPDHFPIYE